MNIEIEEQLSKIITTGIMNMITIGRYINQVPELINNDLTRKEIENARKKYETKQNDNPIVKIFENIRNSLISIGSDTDKIHLPNYFNSSSLLLVFTFLEDTSRELGKVAKKLAGTRLGINDIYEQNDVKKVKIYLEKHIGINFSEVNESWCKIDHYIQVRNCIIHRNSKINEDGSNSTSKLKEYLEKEHRIEFQEGVFSIKDPKYVEDFLDISFKYLSHIVLELGEKFKIEEEA